MKIWSPAIENGGEFPRKFTCEGDNVSPELHWEGAPKETEAFVLILHDPDAPRRDGFTHWLLYDISASVSDVKENVPKQEQGGAGVQGRNDSGQIGYTGPCPPSGRHRYYTRLYALRKKLGLPAGATAVEVKNALEGKVIEEAEFIATYEKQKARGASKK